MQYEAEGYSFEIPDSWKKVVGIKKTKNKVIIRELLETEPEYSGIVATLKTVKRKKTCVPDVCEQLGTLTSPSGETFYLFAEYGRENSCSEEASDLYWRLMDKMYTVFKSIHAAAGYSWEAS